MADVGYIEGRLSVYQLRIGDSGNFQSTAFSFSREFGISYASAKTVLRHAMLDTDKAIQKLAAAPRIAAPYIVEGRMTARPSDPAESTDGSLVYFVHCESLAVTKIGFTTHLARRMVGLRTACPAPLVLLATMPGSEDDEQFLHHKFHALRSHGEWFRHGAALVDFIGGIKARVAA